MADKQLTAQDLLDQILATGREIVAEGKAATGDLTAKGKELAARGEDFLVDKLDIDDTEAGRAALRKGAGVGAAAGAMALLLSSRSGRKLAAIGGLGGLGVLAYRAYKSGKMPTSTDEVIGLITGQQAEARCEILVKAMVAAAQADGTITEHERNIIESHNAAAVEVLRAAMDKPPNAKAIAALADSDQAAREIYAVSARIANGVNPKERDYLDTLAMALKLDPDVAARIETDMRTG